MNKEIITKIMARAILLSVFMACILNAANAQNTETAPYLAKPRLSIGAEFSIPENRGFGNVFTIGVGGSGKFEIPITTRVYATATAGFTTFYLNKDVDDNLSINKSYVPLKAGAKYYFGNYFYGEGEIGASIGTNQNSGTSFAWSPGVGVSYPVTKDGYIDAGARFEKWAREGGNIDQIVFRVAYKF